MGTPGVTVHVGVRFELGVGSEDGEEVPPPTVGWRLTRAGGSVAPFEVGIDTGRGFGPPKIDLVGSIVGTLFGEGVGSLVSGGIGRPGIAEMPA